tara:strand:+ start:71 stop:679 length:609 start_codon:yes stop_codon:yes gene_type:complete
MNDALYISRRCQHCHELLIFIHKNKDKLKQLFTIIDIDTAPFPSYIKSVPLLNYNNNIILGKDIKEQINMYIAETVQPEKPPLEYGTIPKQSSNTDIYSNKNNTINDKSEEDKNYSVDALDGYCIDGVCGINFSSIEEDSSISTSTYEVVEFGDEKNDNQSMDVKKENELSNSYENFLQERNMDIPENPVSKEIDFTTLDLR